MIAAFLNPPTLGAQLLGDEESEAVARVIARGELFRFTGDGQESENDSFEREISAYVSAVDAVAVSSGSAGLRAALVAVGVRPGDRVVVSAYTFVATAAAVVSTGALPIPVDHGARLEVDLRDLVRKMQGAKAVVVVYPPGLATNVREVLEVARTADVPVVEDACQALGVRQGAGFAGVIGNVGVYSFQQGKQLTAGEGGAVVSSDPALLARVRRYADHGACRIDGVPSWEPELAHPGDNLRLSELQAAVLRVQLRRLPTMLRSQRTTRAKLTSVVREHLGERLQLVESIDPLGDSCAHLYMLCGSERLAQHWIDVAAAHRVLLRRPWSVPWHVRGAFARHLGGLVNRAGVACPRTESWAPRLLAIAIPPRPEVAGALEEALQLLLRDPRLDGLT